MIHNPFLSLDQQMIGDIYTSPEIMDNLAMLTDEFGSRFGGTEGERLAAEFIEAKLQAYGLQNVRREPIEYIGWRRGETTLDVVSPVQKSIPCISLPHSPPTDMQATLFDVGDGGPADFEKYGNALDGKIAMVNSKTQPRGSSRWVHRSEKYGRAMLAGASAFIFVNHYPGYGPATGSIGDNDAGPIPALSVSYEDGAYLQRLLKRHGEAGSELTLRIRSTDEIEPMVSWNVMGDLPGTRAENGAGAELVMLGCHYDGHDISQGANDPASGVVAVIEAARVLAHHAPPLPHSLRFVLWGVEEIGLLGSHDYVRQHADELDNLRFYYNMDAAGGARPKDVVLNEWPQLEPIFEAWQEQMALDFEIGQSVSAHSDHFPFLMAGVPTGGMEPVARDLSGRGYGHTRYDTLDKLEIRTLREAAALAARLALRLASADEWPASRRSEAEVEAIFDKPRYQEERAITAKIAEHVAAFQRGDAEEARRAAERKRGANL